MKDHRTSRQIDHAQVPLFLLILIAAGLLTPAGSAGQELIVPLRFSFSDPGARSMGFGGAFVALADDATAALANPAGLAQLVDPEVSIEARRWSYSTLYTKSGRVEGLPSGFGLDTTEGLETARSEEVLTGLSFLSVVYPRERWSIALFRHQLANFEFSGETQGLFGGGTDCCQTRFFDQRATTDLELESYGISGGYRIHERLDLGFGVSYHQTRLISRSTIYRQDDDSLESIVGPNSYLPERTLLSEVLFGEDSDWSLIAGLLWRPAARWTVGGVYRQGSKIGLVAELSAGEAADLGVSPGEVILRLAERPVQLPHVLGLGFAYRVPDDRLTVSFQWDHIDYSSILESLGATDVELDDANEFHLGGEYVFLRTTPILAVRAGAWWDPEHQVRTAVDDPYLRALQPRGKDQMHYTAGLGVVFKRIQIDLAADIADEVETLSVSAIYSF